MDKINLEQYQKTLAEVLLETEPGVNAMLVQQMHLPATDKQEKAVEVRLNIYRNNVIYSLSQALAAQFPVVQKLVGENFFLALARDYVRLCPPQEVPLFAYGQSFPNFIRVNEHCQPLPYLADVALLEYLYQSSVHAADDLLLKPEELAQVKPEGLGDLLLPLQSSAILFSSPYPTAIIREENLKDDPKPINLESAEGSRIVLFRKDLEVNIVNLDGATFHMLSALQNKQSITQAWQSTKEKLDLDEEKLSAIFSFLLNLGVFKTLKTEQRCH